MKILSFRFTIICNIAVLLLLSIMNSGAAEKNSSLAQQILAKIQQNKNISISNLKVTDEGKGEIKLQGTTNLYGNVYFAVQETASFPIKMVNNDIEVIPSEQRKDADIERVVRSEIKKSPEGNSLKDINVIVKNGVVQIIGSTTRKDVIDKIFNKVVWIPGIVYARNEVKIKK